MCINTMATPHATDVDKTVQGIFIFLLILKTQAVVGDLFSSFHNMEALFHQENRLLSSLNGYIDKHPEKLSLLKTKFEHLSKVRPPEQTAEDVIGDPIAAYTLVRRLTREWPLVLNFLVLNVDVGEDIRAELHQLPKGEDLGSALRGLARLQEIYKLDNKQLTQGTTDDPLLTAHDCFEIGKFLLEKNMFREAATWFRDALEMKVEQNVKLQEDEVMPHLFFSILNSDCDNRTTAATATKTLHQLLLRHPNHTLDKNSAQLFKQPLSPNCTRSEDLELAREDGFTDPYRIYSEACRGIGLKHSSKLKCFYIHYNNPLLLIGPFKMEELHLNPPVLMFHDVISDQEIADIKEAFIKVKSPCMVTLGNHSWESDGRTCDVGWVSDDATMTSARLTRRVGDMANLNMETAEYNQVASYGVGGHYGPHVDPRIDQELPKYTNGKRVATVMFYLNEVKQGGCTVFPVLKLSIKPVKGSAVMWFNLDHKSHNLHTTLHGGCPILKGSKWVLNKWIHEGKQTGDMFCPARGKFPKPRYYMNGVK